MADLEEQLKKADGEGAKVRLIVTDGALSSPACFGSSFFEHFTCSLGAFSMDGDVAPLDKICSLADKFKVR